MSYKSDLQDVELFLKVETDRAWGFHNPSGSGVVWIPKSQAEFEGGEQPSRKGVLTAPEWLLIDKGLI